MTTPAPAQTATILVSCPDRPGLVAALSQLLFERDINILTADQHTDSEAGQFFQRIHMDLTAMTGDRPALERALDALAERFAMHVRLAYGSHKKRMAIMVSKYDHCLHDLVLRKKAGELDCEIPVVVSNHSELGPVVHGYGIPFHCLPVQPADKHAQEEKLFALFERERIDLVVLARYMQIVTEAFCERYAERAINIHHSFLPAFVGGRPYHQAYERGVKIVGATAHYVTAELDDGPIIAQDVMHVSHRDSVEDLVRKGRDLERMVLSRAVRMHLEDRVLVSGRKTVVFS